MAADAPAAFFSYCREDSDFALRLAEDLKAAGANVWIDQLDIEPGMPWDREVEDALAGCARLLVILSPVSVKSENVRDEVGFALSKQKRVVPVLYRECDVPLRLARLQHIDFRTDYVRGLKALLKALGVEPQPQPVAPVQPEAPNERWPPVSDVIELQPTEDETRLEQEGKAAAEKALQAEPERQRLAAEQQLRRLKRDETKAVATGASFFSRQPLSAKVVAVGTFIIFVGFLFYWTRSRQPTSERATGAQKQELQSETPDAVSVALRSGWAVGSGGTILHTTDGGKNWEAQSSGTTNGLNSIFGTSDGAQLWAVGGSLIAPSTILHYTAQAGRWETQISGATNGLDANFLTRNALYSIFGTSDGAQVWAVGWPGTILHYTAQAGRWETQISGTANSLYSIFATSDGAQLWAVGDKGTILHTTDGGKNWEAQSSGTTKPLSSIFGTSDWAQLWAVGNNGTILHYTAQAGRWEAQSWGTTSWLSSIFGTSNGARLWAVGDKGTILHYTAQAGRWEAQRSGTTNSLSSIFGTSDGAQLWAVGDNGTILHTTDGGKNWVAQSSGATASLRSVTFVRR